VRNSCTVKSLLFLIAALFIICGRTNAQEISKEKQRRPQGPAGVDRRMSDEELTRETEIEYLRTINRALRKTAPFEKRIIGEIQKIDCGKGIVFTIKTENANISLTSKDFLGLQLNAFVPMSGDSTVGCDADLSKIEAIVTYRETPAVNSRVLGDVVAIEFVPKTFRILSEDEMNQSIAFEPDGRVTDISDRAAILRAISKELLVPEPWQKREVGYLEKIDCRASGSFFHIRTNEKDLTLYSQSQAAVKTRLFTRELEGMQFGCAMKPIDIPVVFIFSEKVDAKTRTDGELFSLEFVPRDLILFMHPEPRDNRLDTARLDRPKRKQFWL
jgi:hypothetical protein